MEIRTNDKRDMRDPETLGNRIKQIQKNNPGITVVAAANMADQMYQYFRNGKVNK